MLCLGLLLAGLPAGCTAARPHVAEDRTLRSGDDPLGGDIHRPEPPLWAVDAGVTYISENHTHATLRGRFDPANGKSGGEIYKLTVTRTLVETDFTVGDHVFHPRWEVPFTTFLVNENESKSFPAFALAIGLRWVDFPWNDYIYTNIATAGGLFWSSNILNVDRERQEGHRSHLKFHWPIQASFALPNHRDYQFVIFGDHSSGGETFDSGGFDTYGFGLRITF